VNIVFAVLCQYTLEHASTQLDRSVLTLQSHVFSMLSHKLHAIWLSSKHCLSVCLSVCLYVCVWWQKIPVCLQLWLELITGDLLESFMT